MLQNLKKSAKNLTSVQGIALMGMFTALYVALGVVKLYITPDNRFSLTFLAMMASGYFLGGIPAFIVGAAGDVLNFILFPSGGAFFPGYTISAALSGLFYGLFMYGNSGRKLFGGLVISKIVITLVVSLLLNTYWSSLFSPSGFYVILAGKVLKTLITLPIQLVLGAAVISMMEKTGLRRRYAGRI